MAHLRQLQNKDRLWLLENIIESFETASQRSLTLPSPAGRGGDNSPLPAGEGRRVRGRIGLPLGNLTSQLFANVYMNKFDQWVKHALKSHYYIRYADDFIFLSRDKSRLEDSLPQIQRFLQTNRSIKERLQRCLGRSLIII
ncbi:MAG: RNA-directed DNA polymerase [Candidatus Magasanikbacteria bacterium]|nr:RNA-directed DNA polymerase [Candidatus Magasanikbacteria bacterium]